MAAPSVDQGGATLDRLMWRSGRPFPVLPVAIGAVLVLLALLATLQYRWAGELSEAEQARLRSVTRSRAEALARDFDNELTAIFQRLTLSGEALRSGDFGPWTQAYEAWRRGAAWPSLVQAVYLLPSQADLEALRRYDPDQRAFVAAAWPASLAGLRARIAEREAPGRRGPPFPGPIVEEVPALVLVAFDRERREPPEAQGVGFVRGLPPSGVLVVVLDAAVMKKDILPALAARHFGGADGLDHDVWIVRQRQRDELVWTSRPDLPRGLPPEAAAGLFELRFQDGPGPARGGPGFTGRRVYGEDSGRWRLLVANRAGPLEQVVAKSRLRNLAVGFGILLLLVATMSLVIVSADRARRLGQRQMEFVSAVS